MFRRRGRQHCRGANAGSQPELGSAAAKQRREEEALRASERRFRLLAENAQDVIFETRLKPTRAQVYISPAVTKILGYTPEEFYADPDFSLKIIFPADRPLLEETWANPVKFSGRAVTFRFCRKDGAVIWVERRTTPVYDQAGNLVAVQGILRDVSERKQAEEERERLVDQLAAEQRWLQTVIERAAAGIILYRGSRGERAVANARAEELFGRRLTSDEGARRFAGQIHHPGGKPYEYDELASVRALHGHIVHGEEAIIRRPDGQELSVLASAAPIRDSDGKIIGAVVVLEDITQIRELEREREEWTSVIAHDLRQPVTVIDGYAKLLLRQADRLRVPVKERVEHILASATQLNRMIADLLDVSRIESRRLTLDRHQVDFAALVGAVVERTTMLMTGHPVRVTIVGEIPRFAIDPGRIEQVLDNLLSNAAKYSYPNTDIVVDVERRDAEVEVSVTNLGPGIEPEELPKLFRRFYRTREARVGQVGGVGLGLYISKGLIEAHGGRIWAESTPGRTTTFHFTLPLRVHPK